jgi:hypothetical protein
MHLDDWTPVYLTEDERAEISAILICNAEIRRDLGFEEKSRRSYYLAGLITFATSPEVRA